LAQIKGRLHVNLLALLACLAAQYAYPPQVSQAVRSFYGRLCLSCARRLNAGDRNSGIVAWLALMALALIPVAVLTALAAALHPAVVWLLDVAVLYVTLRFLSTTGHVSAIESSLRTADIASAANRLAEWQAEPVEVHDAGLVSRLAAEHALREAHHGTFAPLLWFLILPGPLGLVLYPLALRAARSWEHLVDPDERDFGWFAARAFNAIDWIPQRTTAFVFAIVGDFEDALLCWRSQSTQWIRPEEGIILASGAGALGVRLGEPIVTRGKWIDRPLLGVGEAAREDALASLGGLLWRALIVWLVVYLLVAAIRGA
jgi:adenosylcobinamide-phosphate synthase